MANKFNMQAMKNFAKSAKLKLPKGKPEAVAKFLKKHFTENFEDDDLSMCPLCDHPSNSSLKSCPYCGADFNEDNEEDESEEDEDEEDESEEVEEEVEEDDETDFNDEENEAEEVEDETDFEDEDEIEEEVVPDDVDGEGEEVEEETAIDYTTPTLVQEAKDSTEKIRKLKQKNTTIAYDIGTELKKINDKALYKSLGYGDFKEYCEKELEYTRMMAYMYIGLTNLDRNDTVKLGVSKSTLILRAPERDRDRLLDMAKEGASRSQIEQELKKGRQVVPTEPKDKITIVGRLEDGNIFLPWMDEVGDPATVDNENAFARLEIVTGVLMTIELKENKGLVVSFEKDEPPKEKKKPPKKEKKPPKKEKKEENKASKKSDKKKTKKKK